jgi:hypothetical protein
MPIVTIMRDIPPPSSGPTMPILLAMLVAITATATALAGDFASEMMAATFKFYDPDSTSTCFLVRRPDPDPGWYLVTTAHTVERTKADTAILVLRQAKPDGSYARHDHTITIRKDGKPAWIRHEKQDVAVLRMTGPLPVAVATLPLDRLADDAALARSAVHVCSPLFVLTYPQRFEANGAGFPVARQGIFASPPQLPPATHPTYLADFTTFAGDSGGPVFIDGGDKQPLVVGIVLAQHHHEDKIKSEYEERVIKHPLNMGTVLHARYVRETITAAAAAAK